MIFFLTAGTGKMDIKIQDMEQQLCYYKKLSKDLKFKMKQGRQENNQKQFEPLPGKILALIFILN